MKWHDNSDSCHTNGACHSRSRETWTLRCQIRSFFLVVAVFTALLPLPLAKDLADVSTACEVRCARTQSEIRSPHCVVRAHGTILRLDRHTRRRN